VTNSQPITTTVNNFTFTFPACGRAGGPVFDSSGTAYVSSAISGNLFRLEPGGGAVGSGNELSGTTFAPGGQLGGTAFGKDGKLYAGLLNTNGDFQQPRIVELDPATGAILRVVATAADGLGMCPGFLAVDPVSGDLFTDDYCSGSGQSGAIVRISNPAGPSPTVSVYANVGEFPDQLVFAPNGTLYAAVSSYTCSTASNIVAVGVPSSATTPNPTSVASIPGGAAQALALSGAGPQGQALGFYTNSCDGYQKVDLTTTTPTITQIATGDATNGVVVMGRDGCLYATQSQLIYKITGPGLCTSSSTTPEITLTETAGLATPKTGSLVTFTGTLHNFPSPTGTPVIFEVTGANTQPKLVAADSTGRSSFSYSGILPGGDTIVALAVANGAGVTSAPLRIRWLAGKHTSFISVNRTQAAGPIGRPATVTANLTDVSTRPPIAIRGARVAISLGGQTCTATTNQSGSASCTVTPTGQAGLVSLTATYAGSSTYTSSTASTPFAVSAAVGPPPPSKVNGYWLVAADGGIFAFGGAVFHGSTGNIHLNRPVVGIAATPSGRGYWLVASDGGIFTFGDAAFYGSKGNQHLNAPIVAMAATPSGRGYWLVASDGGIFSFGDATFYGSTGNRHLNAPVVGMAATPDGHGYWLAATDGSVFTFGDAAFYGSTGNIRLNKPVVGIATTSDRHGYWLDASDGGVFTFGDAGFHGSAGNLPLNRPVVGMAATPDSQGYWLDASDGGIFTYGDASFYGSEANHHLNAPMVAMAASPTSRG
jgi:hypothetical protein